MAKKESILPGAQAQFSTRRDFGVQVDAAFKATESAHSPAPGGMEGWTSIHSDATYTVVSRLKSRGFTHVSLIATGFKGFKQVSISAIL